MKTFKKWLVLREAQTGGTKRPKATGGGFVANRSQFWGPAAHFGHDAEKVQSIWNKAIAAGPAAVGSLFADELGYSPEAIPKLEKWPTDTMTRTHVFKDGTLPLQVLIKYEGECMNCGEDLDCLWKNCQMDEQEMKNGIDDPNYMDKQIVPKMKEKPSIYPNPQDYHMVEMAKKFTEALIMRDLWWRLVNDPEGGNQTEYVDFKNPKIERRIEGASPYRTLTIAAMFPRTDIKGAQEYE